MELEKLLDTPREEWPTAKLAESFFRKALGATDTTTQDQYLNLQRRALNIFDRQDLTANSL